MVLEIILGIIIGALIIYIYMKSKMRGWEDKIRQDALNRSRAVLKGKITEQIVPMLSAFNYNASDARFIGSPIDYIIFDGYTDDKEMNIVFMDVKKGSSKLTAMQNKIKEAVENKRIKWETLRLD